jgi:hypothetical protein
MATHHETRSRPKDAIAMLQADHHTVRQLFRAYRTARDLATQWEIAQHIFDELDVHTRLCRKFCSESHEGAVAPV